jgi:uncharacterized protein (TIGR00369 family)
VSPADSQFADRVRESFGRQQVMITVGAKLTHVAPGEIDIWLPYNSTLTQQHGFMHAGIVATIADSACGYAAYSLMPAGNAVLSIEFKINLLEPARGDAFVARGRVLRPGKTITVCQADVMAIRDGAESRIATLVATIIGLRDRKDLNG